MSAATVLLTGATGFIGGATAAELLLRHPSCRLLLLARGETQAEAEVRVAKSLGRAMTRRFGWFAPSNRVRKCPELDGLFVVWV